MFKLLKYAVLKMYMVVGVFMGGEYVHRPISYLSNRDI